MLRWILGGREAPGSVEKSPVLCIGEEQPKNCFTELQVLKGHFDIVRFLVQIDDFRCASAGDDGLILVWNIETGERLQELRGHSQQITAITTFTCKNGPTLHTSLITASSDRSLSLWNPDTGNRVQTISDLQSSVKCLLVLERLCVWVSGGEELCAWNKDFQLQCQKQNHSDTGITALIELPKNCIAAAMDKEIVIYRLTVSIDSSLSMAEIRCLSDHQDQIRALINVNDRLFASGSHAGELILWDAIDWNVFAYEHILWEESQACTQSEIRLAAPKPSEMSIQHLTTNGKHVLAAVGSGLYVYSVLTKTVVAYRKVAHDSNVLHTMMLSDSELMSCSEDGSVRMWEIQDLPLTAEPASPGFFGMWTFGRPNKQTGPPSKKVIDVPNTRTLELTGDLIGHSGAVQMFVSFGENGLVTCSADHLLILWKNGERQSRLRSLALFQKLEENGGL
ncbi:WD repeat-containing protein 41 isoform X2 [Micropterus salmoides]|uniref:WD repeat-containing protein 41 n=1 Tax=Micropterus dolomieu TaxID=147949 RepID=UPI0018EBD10D|nr:WD repeat-containing protein 41 isoform X2 [Micropterus salmoides]XP_045923623.1 WD repeat-containing protein 41 [Micropterus dolomieu]XP_045923624.1 WD repeat-containing protein 41 [Micropterus dolomieu]